MKPRIRGSTKETDRWKPRAPGSIRLCETSDGHCKHGCPGPGPSGWCQEPGWRACSWVYLVCEFGMRFKVHSLPGEITKHATHHSPFTLTQSFKTLFFFGGRCYFIGGPHTPVWCTSKTVSVSTLFDSKMNDRTLQRSHDSTDSLCSSFEAVLPLSVACIWISSDQVKAFNCLQVGSVMQWFCELFLHGQ